jgi:hypothetical protein
VVVVVTVVEDGAIAAVDLVALAEEVPVAVAQEVHGNLSI